MVIKFTHQKKASHESEWAYGIKDMYILLVVSFHFAMTLSMGTLTCDFTSLNLARLNCSIFW